MRTLTVFITAAAFLTAAGCGSGNGLNLAKVSGKVTFKGEPITYGTIMFEPQQPGPPAVGTIGPDGSFVLSTESSGDGAVVGTHLVAVIGLEEATDSKQVALPDPQKSPREYMVAKSKASARPARGNDATFTDKSGKTFRVTVPEWLGKPDTSHIKVAVASGSNTVLIDVKEDGSVQVTP